MVNKQPIGTLSKISRIGIDEARFVAQDKTPLTCWWRTSVCALALVNLLLGVVPHFVSLVTMAVPTPHWDVTSDYLPQVRDVWITIRDSLLPPDMLAMRTAGPNWNHSKLYGSFAAFRFFLMVKGESKKGKSEPPPEWSNLCCNFRQQFGYYESEKWPLDDDWLHEDYYNEALALTLIQQPYLHLIWTLHAQPWWFLSQRKMEFAKKINSIIHYSCSGFCCT